MGQCLKAMLGRHKHTYEIVIGFPSRYDQPKLNQFVHTTNKLYQNQVGEACHTTFISTNSIPMSCFMSHTLHLYTLGNNRLINLIVDEVVSREVETLSACKNTSCYVESNSEPQLSQAQITVRPKPHFHKLIQNYFSM